MQRRFSTKREHIKTLLMKHKGALSATTIRSLLPELDLTTIYRNLEIFIADGTVRKLYFDSSEALYEFQAHPHHHAVCSTCNRVIHFNAPDEQIKKLLGLTDFIITDFEMTIRGKCPHKTV